MGPTNKHIDSEVYDSIAYNSLVPSNGRRGPTNELMSEAYNCIAYNSLVPIRIFLSC